MKMTQQYANAYDQLLQVIRFMEIHVDKVKEDIDNSFTLDRLMKVNIGNTTVDIPLTEDMSDAIYAELNTELIASEAQLATLRKLRNEMAGHFQLKTFLLY